MAGRYAREALKLGQFFVFLPVRFFLCQDTKQLGTGPA